MTCFILTLVYFSACVKDKPIVTPSTSVKLSQSKKVYVVSEGPFQTGANGLVSLYDPETGNVIENYYKAQNNAELGNIVQSINYFNNHFYIVVNNSNKIVVCDNQFKKTEQINDLHSPRYILQVTNQKAYVTDLYADAISVVNLNTNTKISSIACPGKTEKLVLIYNKVFVTNTDKEYVYIINTINDTKSDSIYVGKNAGSIVIDKNDKIWVLSGGTLPNQPGRLTMINPLSNKTETEFIFGNGNSPNNLTINSTKDTLYFIDDGIYRMPVTDKALPSNVFIPKAGKNFYGLGVNPNNGEIYVADVLDYSQKSNIYIYHPNGNQKAQFKAGIISNGFYFE